MVDDSRLKPRAFNPLPLGSVQPAGWLRNQLRIQAEGLTGHLDEFWPDIRKSGWIGGDAEGWERGPYWLDGLVPLAFLLRDERLLEKAHRWMDYILEHQRVDGWLGPVKSGRYEEYDPWPVFVMLKVMVQYQEATGEERVIPAMLKFLRRLDGLLDEKPLFVWGKSRWADLVLSVHWLYERTGEEWLLGLAARVRNQGYDWRAHFENFRFTGKMAREDCQQSTHVVNNGMAVKQPGVWWRQSGDEGDRRAVFRILEMLDAYHGQVNGLFTGDEHYAGLNPSQGTELCAVVEFMFSLEMLVSILGEGALADRLERIAFNALPAPFKPDMWAHQYDQQVNQVLCKVTEDPIWTNNGPDANIFGLAPHYGCCTANMHQGWPKFAAHLWMGTPDGGLAAVAYAPSLVEIERGGKPVRIEVETGYPFGEEIAFRMEVEEAVDFPLYLRIPGWAEGARVRIGDDGETVEAGAFHRIRRMWEGAQTVRLHLPMRTRVSRRYHSSVAVERGPLVYALPLGEEWRQVGGEEPHADWEVYPTTPWNYGLEIDPDDPDAGLCFEAGEIGDCPLSPDGAPVRLRTQGRRVPEWELERNVAGPLPQSPVGSAEPLEELTLIPYGCTNLRVAEFPLVVKETL